MQSANVESTTLSKVGYDAATLTLELEFHSGERYCYREVPPTTYQQLMEAASKGRFFNHHIRELFPCQHLPKRRSA